HRGEVQCIEGTNRHRKRLDRACDHERAQLEQCNGTDQYPYPVGMRSPEAARMDSRPDLVLEEPARYERFLPEGERGNSCFSQEMSERHRRVEIRHRSSRSRASSASRSSVGATGFRGGTVPRGVSAGLTTPSRTRAARWPSDRRSARVADGGVISATTRSRSVTKTVSPL